LASDPDELERVAEQFRREMWDRAAVLTNVRLSRHAKNQMRLYGISLGDVEAVAEFPDEVDRDESGNWRLEGVGIADRAIIVVVAGDRADFVITTFPRG